MGATQQNLGGVLFGMAEFERAIPIFVRAAAARPFDVNMHTNLASAYAPPPSPSCVSSALWEQSTRKGYGQELPGLCQCRFWIAIKACK